MRNYWVYFGGGVLVAAIAYLVWNPPTEIYFLAFTFLSIGIAMRPPSGSLEKVIIIIVILVLGALTIKATYAERIKHNSELEEVRKESKSINNSLIELKNLVLANNRVQKELAEYKAPPESLRQRALLLSSEILRFLMERQANEPESEVDKMLSFEHDFDKAIKYSQQTMSIYSERFGARVIAIRNGFAREGLKDEQLDKFFEHPTNPTSIKIIGERIGALAEQLKQ